MIGSNFIQGGRMLGTLIGLLVIAVITLAFGWLVTRAWGSRRTWVKWPGAILTGLATCALALILIVGIVGLLKLYLPASNPAHDVPVARTPEQVARGAKFAAFCAGCHSSANKLPLDGGNDNFAQIPNGPALGFIYAPNLTPAGEIANWSGGELVRAIREGVHKSGRPLIVMPSETFRNLSDADVQAIVAYLRSQPAIKHNEHTDENRNEANLLGTLFVGAGIIPTSVQPPITQPVPAPPQGTNLDNGKYLVANLDCRTCHGVDLAGGIPSPVGPPAGPNLTALIPKWSEGEFIKVIRTGVDLNGHALDPAQMPWKEISSFASDDDLKAMYVYLHGLSPIVKPAP
jgi:mono/diheme cytochrome c family protein